MEHLIPAEWFHGLSQVALLAIAAVSVGVLVKAADFLVDGACGIARRAGISEVIIGATVVSLGTTSPEAAVSVMAAWAGEPGLALGNAIGSIIADTGLIFGLGCLIAVLPADKKILSRQGWVQFGSALLLAVLCYAMWFMNGDAAQLARWVGALLLLLLAGYMWISIRWSRESSAAAAAAVAAAETVPTEHKLSISKAASLIVLGLALVLLSSHVLIQGVTELAQTHWKVPQVVIAATLVAFGTSLPELVIGITSVLKGHKEILVGNVIGADILNVLFVIGASAIAAPLPILDPNAKIPEIALYVHLPAMLAILVLFRVFIARASKTGSFQRWYGVPLVLIYIGYTVLQYWIS